MTTHEQKKKFLVRFKETRGNATEACEEVKISRTDYKQWLHEDTNFKSQIDTAKEEVLDFVEEKLLEKIAGVECEKEVRGKKTTYTTVPDTSAIIFYLKARGRRRGYSKDEAEDAPEKDRVIGLFFEDELNEDKTEDTLER